MTFLHVLGWVCFIGVVAILLNAICPRKRGVDARVGGL
jgi:hypothetical protein